MRYTSTVTWYAHYRFQGWLAEFKDLGDRASRLLQTVSGTLHCSTEAQDVQHGPARLRRPVPLTHRSDREKHHGDLIVLENVFLPRRSGVKTDHRRRTPAQRAGSVNDRGRAEGSAADRFVPLLLRFVVVNAAGTLFRFGKMIRRHIARFHHRGKDRGY